MDKKELTSTILISISYSVIFVTLASLAYYIYMPNVNYEDKDMTKTFYKNNNQKLEQYKISVIDSRSGNFVERKGFFRTYTIYNNSISIDTATDFYKIEDSDICNNLDIYIDVENKTLKFNKDFIAYYGKEYMFRNAESCVYHILKYLEEEITEEIADKKEQEQDYERYKKNLKQKFELK